MAQVDHTIQKSTGTKLDGAPMIGRVCNFSPNPDGAKAIEDIILYDEVNYKLHLRVIPENIPIPLEKNIFKSSLKRLAYDKTELVVEANIELKWTGYFLYPVIKKGFNKN